MTCLSASIVASNGISSPFTSFSFKVIKLSTLVLFKAELSISLISSSKLRVMSVSSATMVDESAGLKVKTGAVESTTQNVPEVALITLSDESSTASMATLTTCPLTKSLSGLIVITFLSESIVAVKATGELSDVYSSVIKPSTFESVMAESSGFLTASLKVRDTFEEIGTQFDASGGTKATVGAVASAAVKVIELALIALSEASSTVAPIAT